MISITSPPATFQPLHEGHKIHERRFSFYLETVNLETVNLETVNVETVNLKQLI